MKQNVRVWDLPIRLFHWILVVLMVVMIYTGNEGGDWLLWHIRVGYAIATLLIFRLIWGVIGSQTARFSQFVKGPSMIIKYLRGELSEDEVPGHNPLGALMVLALLALLIFQTVTGLLSSDIDSFLFDGPLVHLVGSELSEEITIIHKLFVNILLGFIAMHVAAVLFYWLVKKTNLIRPMFTGIKPMASSHEIPRLEFSPLIIAVAVLAVAMGLVYVIVTRL